MPEPTLVEVNQALGQLREVLEKKDYSHLDTFDKSKVDKINDFLDAQETKNQEIVIANGLAKAANEELKERIDGLEKTIVHSSQVDKKTYKDSDEYKAFDTYLRNGDTRLEPEVKALLRTDINADGGYRTGEELDSVIIKNVTEISPVRAVSRVRTVGAKTFRMVVRKTLLTATFEGEAGNAAGTTASAYGTEVMNTWRQTATIPATMDQLMNDAFDMESDIFTDATEAFAASEGAEFINGVNPTGPSGILVDSRITGLTSTTSLKVDAKDYILVQGELKTGYNNGMFALNRRTIADLRTKQSTTGQFLFMPGLNGATPNEIAGAPYIVAQDMPDIAAGNKAVLYGDFFRGYTIIDRTGLSVIRDDLTRKTEAIIEFTIHRWLNGQVTLPEAFKTITVKA